MKHYYVVYRNALTPGCIKLVAFSSKSSTSVEYAESCDFDAKIKRVDEPSLMLMLANTRPEDFVNLDK